MNSSYLPNCISAMAQMRIAYLQDVLKKLELQKYDVKEGRIEASKCSDRPNAYYWIHQVEQNGGLVQKREYLRKDQRYIAAAIAQKDYDEYLKMCIIAEIENLKFINEYKTKAESIYENLSPARKEIIRPMLINPDEYIRQWCEEEYETKGFELSDCTSYFGKNGVRVRSKSELYILNSLIDADLAFRYECELKNSRGKWYPDFTILNKRTLEVYYWEHCGMMDNQIYANHFVKKMNDYQLSGLRQGKNLILTFEDSLTPLSTKIVQDVINTYLI
jgi:hypothetical protein